ncbi:MAG: hypothetical protein ACE5GB_12940 [Acidimicrobiales bacterium]
MAVFNASFQVLAGREADARAFAEEAASSHGDHYSALMKETATSRVTWTIQESPSGTLLNVWFEADDAAAAFEHFATATVEAAEWFRGRISTTLGLDMTQPLPGPPPEVVLDFRPT